MKKLSLMKPSELKEYIELWRGRMSRCKTGSFSWKVCRWMVDRIKREIEFKNWLLIGFKKLEQGTRH